MSAAGSGFRPWQQIRLGDAREQKGVGKTAGAHSEVNASSRKMMRVEAVQIEWRSAATVVEEDDPIAVTPGEPAREVSCRG